MTKEIKETKNRSDLETQAQMITKMTASKIIKVSSRIDLIKTH